MNTKIQEKISPTKERLVEFIKYKGLNNLRFTQICGLSKSFVQNIRNSINSKTFDNKIAPNFPDLNKSWLYFGEGDMLNTAETNTNTDMKSKDLEIQFLREKVNDLEEKLAMCKELREKDRQLLDKSLSPDKNIVNDKL